MQVRRAAGKDRQQESRMATSSRLGPHTIKFTLQYSPLVVHVRTASENLGDHV